jgi:tape measure domain-containing protein
MSSTDDRIVRMQFDNKSFMKGAADTQKALADTNKAVDGAGKSRGLLDLSSQMGTVGVTASKMAIVTTTALATIANKVVNTGLNMAKALTLDPIKQGFTEYESLLTKQNVIMNATGKSAGVVKGYLNQLNHYSDQTIYSFGNMTDAIQKFVNAGVPLKTSVTTIKGIANAAAFAGASSEEANRAMYAFSQSMSLGFVQLQDWNQIENANLGTIKFKDTLLEAGVAAGTLTRKGNGFLTQSGKFVSATKGWRDGLQEQWATTEVLNTALGKYADKNTVLGKKAFAAAQQVRTFSAFMDTLKESIGSGWSQVFTALFGNLKQATSFWTGFSNAIGGVVKNFFNFVSSALQTWRAMGGFEKTIQAIKNVLSPIGALLKAIGTAWDTAFPSSNKGAGKTLYGISAGLELLTRPLLWLSKGIPAITPILVLFFTALHNGITIVSTLIGWLKDLIEVAVGLVEIDAPNAGGFLGFIQSIVAWVQQAVSGVDDLLNKGKSLKDSFSGIHLPKVNLPSLPSAPSLPSFGGADSAASGAASGASSAAAKMQSALDAVLSLGVKIGDVFSNLWTKIKEGLSKISPTDVVQAFNLAILATMSISVSRFLNTLTKSFKGFGAIGESFAGLLDKTGNSLADFAKAQKREATAKIILNVAIALGILAASLWVLSKIPAKELGQALAAMAALGFILNRSMSAFADVVDKLDKKGTVGRTIAFSVAMLALAGSMVLLAAALILFNYVDWTSLIKGLGSMIVMMKVLEGLGNLGEHAAKNLIAGAFAIGVTAASMILLAGALLLFKLVDWGSIVKAGVVLGGLTLAVGALAMIPYEGIAKVGLALLGASVGMLALANALIMFALVKWESIGKAAVVLLALTISLGLLMAVGGEVAAGLFLAVAAGMVGLALACLIFNKVDWESIGKAAVVLLLLTAAVAVLGAILTVFLYAIAPVAPVLIILAAGFALLGVGLLAFAAAMALAVTLAAAGTAAFAALATGAAVAVGVFLQTLALQAPIMSKSVLAILQSIIDTIVKAVPMIIQGFKDLFKAIMKEMSSGDKKKSFGDTVTEWLNKLDQMARKYIPKLVRLGVDIFIGFIHGLQSRAAEIATLGVTFLVKLMAGIGSRVSALVAQAVDIIIKFANGLEANAFRLANAGIALIAKFLHDLASAIRSGSGAIGSGLTDVIDACRDVGVNMVKGLIGGVTSMISDANSAIGGVVGGMISKAKGLAKIFSPSRVFRDIGKFMVMGLTKGVQDNASSAIVAVASMITGAIAVADDYVSKYFQKLDQQAIAARARANGLAAAAARAQKSAQRTKDKGDNKAANQLSKRAKKAAKEARQEEQQAQQARKAAAAKERWEKADSAQRAEIRANQAQNQLAGAKQAEKAAEAARIEANALREQAKHAGSEKERKALLKEAERQRKIAREEAKKANDLIAKAKKNSADALKYQKMAGEEAAAAFQKEFDKEAKADADAKAFDKLTDAEKAEKRRQQAAELQAKAEADLKKAKKLALTDLDAANKLAEQALAEADQARQFLDDAAQYDANASQGGSVGTGEVIDLGSADAAAAAYNNYSDMYDAAYAAAAAGATVQFNQYNSSPESLSDAEIYRQTNNQLTFAADKLAGAAA